MATKGECGKKFKLNGESLVNADGTINKTVYKKLAIKYHPDKPGGDTNIIQELNECKDILEDMKAANYAADASGKKDDILDRIWAAAPKLDARIDKLMSKTDNEFYIPFLRVNERIAKLERKLRTGSGSAKDPFSFFNQRVRTLKKRTRRRRRA